LKSGTNVKINREVLPETTVKVSEQSTTNRNMIVMTKILPEKNLESQYNIQMYL